MHVHKLKFVCAFTGYGDEIQRVFGDVWYQEGLHLEYQGERTFLIRREDRTLHFMFSDKKIVRVDHKMSEEQYFYIDSIWPEGQKILPFVVPHFAETETVKDEETKKEVATVEMVEKMLQKQKMEFQLEMQQGSNRTQTKIIEELRTMNKQMMEGLVSSLGQMLQASITGGHVRLPSIENKQESVTVTEMP